MNDLKSMEKEKKDFDLGRFRKYIHSHQVMILPLFQLQLTLRESIIGRGFWNKNMMLREKITLNQLYPIEDLIEGEMLQKGWKLKTFNESGKKVKRFVRSDSTEAGSVADQANWLKPATEVFQTTLSR